MRAFIFAGILVSAVLPAALSAQTAASDAAPTSTPQHYTTRDTDIGTLLDDPAAKAVVEKNLPGFTTNDQIDMARGMTIAAVQQYSPDTVTDAKLAAIDADLAKLPAKPAK